MTNTDDPFDLNRFIAAQAPVYSQATTEIKGGRKSSHWMWFVFPQFEGLGVSETARRYAIRSRAEAAAYLSHPVLGPRLIACAEATLGIEHRSAREVFGPTDERKLRSCATLFAQVSSTGSVFHRLLERYFHGQPDQRTLVLLDAARD